MVYLPTPSIGSSTRDERLAYVQGCYACITNCDACGDCATFHGLSVELAPADFIEGRAELPEVMMRHCRR